MNQSDIATKCSIGEPVKVSKSSTVSVGRYAGYDTSIGQHIVVKITDEQPGTFNTATASCAAYYNFFLPTTSTLKLILQNQFLLGGLAEYGLTSQLNYQMPSLYPNWWLYTSNYGRYYTSAPSVYGSSHAIIFSYQISLADSTIFYPTATDTLSSSIYCARCVRYM